MKTIHVAAAVILKDGKVYATQRGYGDYKDGWEFPGGKIEPGETPDQALIREIREELDIGIVPEEKLCTVKSDYPAFRLHMECFLCRMTEGTPVLKEHEAARWLDEEALDSVDWLPADRSVLPQIRRVLQARQGKADGKDAGTLKQTAL